uniref:Putative defensin 2.1 n=1 Tax=Medicago sativa TaxID=3879 RepID=Q4G3U6_MEDSA|nr:putative defensin 2.1 precursor [Medicago sativa]
MEKKSIAGLCFLFLILFVAQEIVVTEARTCEHLADTYRGPCFTDASCDDHCKNKAHLISGTCHRLQCFCTQNC